jgi:hypothetical protein
MRPGQVLVLGLKYTLVDNQRRSDQFLEQQREKKLFSERQETRLDFVMGIAQIPSSANGSTIIGWFILFKSEIGPEETRSAQR